MSGQEIKWLDLTLRTPAENLACDEALLDACEEGSGGQVLRFWESPEHFVVVGYSNQVSREVNVEACRRENVAIYRRCSGGGTVLQGPGCLNYTLILRFQDAGPLSTISSTNQYVMQRNREALARELNQAVMVRGITDLAVGLLKFSGNAQRRKRSALVFHGTFLLDFELARIERLLQFPSKQPDYRLDRPHGSFVNNLNVPAERIKKALKDAWGALTIAESVPDSGALVREKYCRGDWNLKF